MAKGPVNVGGFEVSQQIGEGAFSKVYLGASKDPNAHPLHRTVAIKIIGVPAQASKAEYTKKLVKEVRLHKAVVHLNVLRLLQWSEGATSESMWIVLEYCFGGDLFDKITPDRGIPEDLAHLYFTQLLAALQYCHNSGIAHRDVKPENMLLDLEGNLKLADFGLAELFRYQGREKKLVEACGSAPYAAPELALGVPYRAEPIDIWSAGIVLFTLLVGNTPWDQPTEASEEYAAYLTGDLLLEDPWTRIPEGLMSMLQHILNPRPKERATAKDIRAHPWFSIENAHLNAKGQVSDKDSLWSALMSALNDAGEFDTNQESQTSRWSDDSDDIEDASMQVASQHPSTASPHELSRSQAHETLPYSQQHMSSTQRVEYQQRKLQKVDFSQTHPRNHKIGNRKAAPPASNTAAKDTMLKNLLSQRHGVRQSQNPAAAAGGQSTEDRRQHARAAVQDQVLGKQSQRALQDTNRMMMTGMAGAASQYSSLYSVAPSQVSDPNLARWFSYADLDTIWEAVKLALDSLGVEWIKEHEPRGAAFKIQVRDCNGQFISGPLRIQYEATAEDYAMVAPEADPSELSKGRRRGEEDEDVTLRTGMQHPLATAGTGLGQGGYVFKMQTKGDPLERKRLFKEIQARMPAGLVFAR